jgi:Uncharacterized protein encoded in toxicity protection region of plasmid R478, contains von Willebrand factor (vWF) domain
MSKHVIFVLDISGSMQGRKLEQLKQAMSTILTDLHQDDLFSIVLFSSEVQVMKAQCLSYRGLCVQAPWEYVPYLMH